MSQPDLENGGRPNGKYPQINVNTAVSFSVLVVLVSAGVWFAGIRGDIGNHEHRITMGDKRTDELRVAVEAIRQQQATAETRAEGRLARIEALLQDVLTRLAAERRREAPP